jgi:sugar phosphate isomerase/epimerase
LVDTTSRQRVKIAGWIEDALVAERGSAMQRRSWIGSVAMLTVARPNWAEAFSFPNRRFTLDLCPGRIGVGADQATTIALAAKHGFGSVEPMGSYLSSLDDGDLDDLVEGLKGKGLTWGAANLDVNFRSNTAEFEKGLKALVASAAQLQRAGVRRMGTWISPAHTQLNYLENFREHAARLREVAKILDGHGVRLGLEYVGPKTSWTARKHSFVHTLAETRELVDAIGVPNVGIVLDSWHWYCAGETVADLLALRNEHVVAVDLNDAPAGLERDQQIDSRRELPAATGVIDIKGFVGALDAIGYDGPVRAEPFNQSLNALDDEEAVRTTALALQKACAI